MDRYVMFGHSGLFGDYVEIVHALGGWVSKVVVNVPDDPVGAAKTFAQRFDEYSNWTTQLRSDLRPKIEQLHEFRPAEGEKYVIGFRDGRLQALREFLDGRFGLHIETLIHPTAVLSPTAVLGEGVIINAGAVVASHVQLGDYVLINRGATVGHDCQLDAFTRVGPGSNIASSVRTGKHVVIGLGANVIQRLVLGEECLVAAGAVVIRDVKAYTMVAGVPAVVKKSREKAA